MHLTQHRAGLDGALLTGKMPPLMPPSGSQGLTEQASGGCGAVLAETISRRGTQKLT